jgi:hypothetical protein
VPRGQAALTLGRQAGPSPGDRESTSTLADL